MKDEWQIYWHISVRNALLILKGILVLLPIYNYFIKDEIFSSFAVREIFGCDFTNKILDKLLGGNVNETIEKIFPSNMFTYIIPEGISKE